MKTTYILSFLLIGFLNISCDDFFEMSIDLDVPEHVSKLAVTSVMNKNNENTRVLVSYTLGAAEEASEEQLLNNAVVVLSDGENEIDFSLSDMDGIYIPNSEIIFVPEKTYTLSVSTPKYDKISATQKFPKQVQISEVSIDDKKIKIRFKDTAGENNFYLFELYTYNPEINMYSSVGIESFEDSYYWSWFNNGILFKDKDFDGNEVEIVLDHYLYAEPGTTTQLRAVLYHVTEDYFRYDRSNVLSMQTQDNPFTEPVILHRNFDSGYGVFSLQNNSEFEFEYTAK